MNPDLLESQFADLEEPESSERVLTVDLGPSPEKIAETIQQKLQLRGQKG